MNARGWVADFWDEVIASWQPGQDSWPSTLEEWRRSYRGTGNGAVDLDQYPDPWVGDIRGLRAEPRVVVLGLNPGVGYDALQGPSGTWFRRIRRQGYSRCLQRSPAEDPAAWLPVHGKASPYWVRLEKFARRWLQDEHAGHREVLNFELFPWHSPKLTGGIKSPARSIERFVLDPIVEVDVKEVFAFGKPWFTVVERLGLPVVAQWGSAHEPWRQHFGDWTVAVHRLPSGQHLVVSRQSGYSGPPGEERVEGLRARLEDLN